jgi:glycosidase
MAYADGELPDPAFSKEEEVGWQMPPKVRNGASYARIELAQALLMSLDGVPMVFYGDEIGMTGAGDPDNRRDMRFGDQVTEDEKRVLEHFQKLTALRRAHPALRYGSWRTLLRENDCLAFVRAYFDDRVLVILNRSKSARDVSLDSSPELSGAALVNLVTGEQMKSIAGKVSLTVPAMSAAFISTAR